MQPEQRSLLSLSGLKIDFFVWCARAIVWLVLSFKEAWPVGNKNKSFVFHCAESERQWIVLQSSWPRRRGRMNITSCKAEKDKQGGNNWCKEVAHTLHTLFFFFLRNRREGLVLQDPVLQNVLACTNFVLTTVRTQTSSSVLAVYATTSMVEDRIWNSRRRRYSAIPHWRHCKWSFQH